MEREGVSANSMKTNVTRIYRNLGVQYIRFARSGEFSKSSNFCGMYAPTPNA